MKTYLLTAVGVIFLSVIVSLVIPEGRLKKSITFVMRMACILVLIQPLTGIFKIKSSSNGEAMFDYEYICTVYSSNQSEQLEKVLLSEFSAQTSCNVDIRYENGEFRAESVTVEVNSQDNEIIENIYAYLEQREYINITVYAKSP